MLSLFVGRYRPHVVALRDQSHVGLLDHLRLAGLGLLICHVGTVMQC